MVLERETGVGGQLQHQQGRDGDPRPIGRFTHSKVVQWIFIYFQMLNFSIITWHNKVE